MKRFAFPLEGVRRWRHEQAEIEEALLRKLFQELHAVENRIRQIESEERDAGIQLRAQPSIAAEDLANLDHYRRFVRASLRKLEQERVRAEQKTAQQRQRLIEAKRQVELLNRLKDKALREWEAVRSKEEEDLAAELYLAKLRRP